MIGYDDKRNFFRMMMNSPCELTITHHESSRTLPAVCKDISATGMSFELAENSVEVGAKVKVSIESTSSQIPSLVATAKVVRCEPEGEQSCTIGTEIIEMS